jgi:hypothetical protein
MIHRANVHQMNPIEQGVQSFRRILRYKIRTAFRDWPLNADERWEIIVTQTSWAMGMLVETVDISDGLEDLGVWIAAAYSANRQNDIRRVVVCVDRWLDVFDGRAAA